MHTTHSHPQVPNDPHEGRRKRSLSGMLSSGRFWFWTALLVVVATLAIGGAPAYRWFRNRQTDRILEAAKVAARTEDWGKARELSRSVLVARPGDFEAYRIWFRALARLGEPRTYLAASGLFTDPRATPDDRLEAFRVMADQAPQALALSLFASFDQKTRETTAVRVAISPLLIRRGQVAIVEKMLREAPDIATDPSARLALLRVLAIRPTPERLAEARDLFSDLVREGASVQALEGLLILGGVPGGLAPGESFSNLGQWVETQPEANTRHRLRACDPLIAAAPHTSAALYQQCIDRFALTDAAALGDWLLAHGKAAMAADTLTEIAKTDPPAFFSRVRALMKDKRYDEVAAALAEPPSAIDIVELEIAKAAFARARDDKTAETNAWTQALANAAFDQTRNRFLDILQFASILNAQSVAVDAWVGAVRLGWGPLPLYQDLLPVMAMLGSEGRTEDLLAMYRVLARFEPRNPELANNLTYLAMLHQVIPPATAVKQMKELVAARPEILDYLSSLALAHLMAGEPAAALALLPQLEQAPRVSKAMRQALRGTALVLSGDAAQGSPVLREVEWREFLPCEAEAFQRILARSQVRDLPLTEMTLPQAVADPDASPSWRRALERLEKERAKDVLPPLPTPRIPGAEPAEP